MTIGKIDSIFSPTLKEQRPYLVYTPPSYSDTTYTKRGYPVLYLLDGDAHFHSVTGLLQILGTGVNGTFVVPEMIVVAIPNTNRMRDLTPTQAARDFEGKADTALRMTGGGPKFLNFMKSELIPHIDATYRTAPYRVFVGHSLGGLMAFQALYTMPEVFNAYVAIDPSLWWDDRRLLKQAPAFFGKATAPGRTLFVGQANTLVASDTIDNPHYNSIIRMNALIVGRERIGGALCVSLLPQRQPRLGPAHRRVRCAALHLRRLLARPDARPGKPGVRAGPLRDDLATARLPVPPAGGDGRPSGDHRDGAQQGEGGRAVEAQHGALPQQHPGQGRVAEGQRRQVVPDAGLSRA
ncbi:MAG: alpha/beta hydrolase [Gemmatimonadetes bacterium]|nr:alpha/beta hydrolase [Gemmatimonadota bacterium]